MLKTRLLHPQILAQLARLGHGSKILIADGNYPFLTASSAVAEKVFLNLSPGVVQVTPVLQVLVETVPIESAVIMSSQDGKHQSIYDEFYEVLTDHVSITKKSKIEFYKMARSADTALVIATAETRRYANILLTLGIWQADR